MSNDLMIPEKPKFLAKQGTPAALEEFAGGIGGSMPLPQLSIRSKQFRARLDGQETELGQTGELEVILVAARPHVSKRFFEGAYTPGSNDAPDCSSLDGKTPDVAEPVSPTCASCPNNVFGSKGAGKACADYKRVVVLPLINGKPVNTPVVLDIPATSLKTPKAMRGGTDMMWKEYMSTLARHQIDPTTVVSKISFTGSDYPQLAWTFSRYVEESEFNHVAEQRQSPEVAEVLGEDVHQGDDVPVEVKQPAPKQEKKPEPKPAKVWLHDAANEKVWHGTEDEITDGVKAVTEAKAKKLLAVYEDDEDEPAPKKAPAKEAPAPEKDPEPAQAEGSEEAGGDEDVMAEVEKLLGGLE